MTGAERPGTAPSSGRTRRVILAQSQSTAGDALLELSLFWHVGVVTQSSLAVGALAALSAVGAMLAGTIGGRLVDTLARQRLMVVLDLVRMGLVLALFALLALGPAQLVPLYAILPVVSSLTVLHMSAARSLIGEIETGRTRTRANSHLQIGIALGGIAGFGIAGLLYAQGGLEPALIVDALTFLVAALILSPGSRVRQAAAPRAEGGDGGYDGWLAGARVLARVPMVGALAVASIAATVLLAPLDALNPAIVRELLEGPVQLLAALEVCVMAGRVVGSFAAGRAETRRPLLVLAGLMAVTGAALIAVSVAPPDVVVAATYAVLGLAAGYAVVVTVSGIQEAAPPGVMGRVFAFHGACGEALPPLAILTVAAVADALGPAIALRAMALGLAVIALALLGLRRVAERELGAREEPRPG